jgi:O-antigen/teichoic acid export membrane protein
MDTVRRRGSREPSLYPDLLGHAVILLTASGAALTALMTAAIALWNHIVSDPVQNVVIIALLVSSNMVLFTWISLTETILLTYSQFTRANLLNFSCGLARTLAAIVACVVFDVDSLSAWAWWNFAVFVIVSLACVWLLYPYGAPRWRVLWDEIPLGATFGISGMTAALRQNVDLFALNAVAPPHLVGAYGVTRRVLGIAVVTGASLDRLLFNKFAIAGKSGPTATLAMAKKWVLPAIGLTTLTSAAIFVFAPVLALLFGEGFRDVVWIIRVLSWTLVLTAIQFLAFDAINAADQHRVRVAVTTTIGVAGAALIVGLGLAFGISGIFVGIYLVEVSTAAALWATLKVLSDRHRRDAAQ